MTERWKLLCAGGALFMAGQVATTLVQAGMASAQTAQAPRQYRECFIADFDRHADGNNDREMANPGDRVIRIAPGWTPVGGLGAGGRGNGDFENRYVILCR